MKHKIKFSSLIGVISFVVVFSLWLFYQNRTKHKSLSSLNKKSQSFLKQGSVGILFGLDSIHSVVESAFDGFEVNLNNPNEYAEKASMAYRPFSNVLRAVNYVDSNYVIRMVHPAEANKKALNKSLGKHFDPAVKKIFSLPGPSITKPTFLEPVELYQGGVGMIYYLPIKNGWLNVVIDVHKFFEHFEINYILEKGEKIALKDERSNKYFFRHGQFQTDGNIVSESKKFLNKVLIFEMDLTENYRSIELNFRYQLFYGFLIILHLSIAIGLGVFFFLKTKEKYENINDESMLLKILIHDLSNYLQQMGASLSIIDRKHENPEEVKKFVTSANHAFESSVETLNAARDLYRDRVDFKDSFVDLKFIFKELISAHEDIISNKQLEIEIEGDGDFYFIGEPRVFKNQLIGNLFVNSLKHSDEETKVKIILSENHVVLTNISKAMTNEKIEELNSLDQFAKRKLSSTKGLGFGYAIAKLSALNFKVRIQLSVGDQVGEVKTTITG